MCYHPFLLGHTKIKMHESLSTSNTTKVYPISLEKHSFLLKVTRSLLRKAKQFLIPWLIIYLLCMCHHNLISHGSTEGQSLVTV